MELLGRFTVGTSAFGFKFFQNGSSEAVLKYIPMVNMLAIDLTKLDRTANDNGTYNGTYSCVLPQSIPAGSEMKINLFIDGSVLDIFVNDMWATSIRVFPQGENANGVQVFADGPTQVGEVSAWVLDPLAADESGIDSPVWSDFEDPNAPVDVYDLNGRVIKSRVSRDQARDGLEPGIYIIGSKKVIVR